jgi:hypothetical protein
VERPRRRWIDAVHQDVRGAGCQKMVVGSCGLEELEAFK